MKSRVNAIMLFLVVAAGAIWVVSSRMPRESEDNPLLRGFRKSNATASAHAPLAETPSVVGAEAALATAHPPEDAVVDEISTNKFIAAFGTASATVDHLFTKARDDIPQRFAGYPQAIVEATGFAKMAYEEIARCFELAAKSPPRIQVVHGSHVCAVEIPDTDMYWSIIFESNRGLIQQMTKGTRNSTKVLATAVFFEDGTLRFFHRTSAHREGISFKPTGLIAGYYHIPPNESERGIREGSGGKLVVRGFAPQ